MSLLRDLSIVIVHYRTPELLEMCLERLLAFAPNVPVTVVDNCSEDGTVDLLAKNYPRADVLVAPNHSMADAVNTGLKKAETPYVLQMNADVMLEKGTILDMLAVLARPRVGMVGPRCRTPQGRWQSQGLVYSLYYAGLDLLKRASLSVPWLSGCCQLLKRGALLEVGGLDSSLRFYNEDVEWCWRLRRAGYRCELVRASALHVGGASTPDSHRFVLEGFRGGYVLSQRYKSPLYRALHRQGMLTYAAMKLRLARTPDEKQTYRMLLAMFRQKRFEESPFGDTLTETNPDFFDGR